MDIVTYAAAKAYTDKAMEQGGGGGGSNAFYAHYEDDKDNDTLVCDKTFAEIQEAFEAGKAIFAVYDGDVYTLMHVSNGSIQFINIWVKNDEIYGAKIYHEEFEITYDEFDIDDLDNTPTIPTVPTSVSAFNNDVGYLTLDTLPVYDGTVVNGGA